MGTAFARKRSVETSDFKFGHCIGPIGAILQHQPQGPVETPVDPLDENGNRIPGFCPGSVVISADTKRYKKGTVTYCQCSCHGPDRPEAWPGYAAYRAGEAAVVETGEGEEETESAPHSEDSPSLETSPLLGVVEPPLPQLGNPSDMESETVWDQPGPSVRAPAVDDGLERTETKRFKYPEGEVARTERNSSTKQGKAVVLVEWIAYDTDGNQVGAPQWGRKTAKELLS